MTEDKKVWGIHTSDDELFLDENVIAIGWKEMGDLSLIEASREAFKNKFATIFPEDKKMKIAVNAGALYRFIHEAQTGDYVIFPSKPNREIHIGIIESDYIYAPEAAVFVQQRRVKWVKKHLKRTSFSQGALYEIGSALCFFSVRKYADEFLAALEKDFKKEIDTDITDDETVAAIADDIIENTKDFILKELSHKFKGYDLEEFVADLLNAMGYKTKISPHGGDRGIDITAYKDEFPPRLLVQVKSQDSDIGENTIQSLKGAMREGDYGLFVTLSNYKKNAQKYLDNNPIIRGINGRELVDLILRYYDSLSEKYRKMIPLKKVYIPVMSSD